VAVTIKDIAKIVGVSPGTVDRAIHNRGRIKPEIAERILKAAEDLHYKPNKFAKSLSNKRKQFKIVFIQHVINNPFIEMLRAGIQKAADEFFPAGISLSIKPCENFNAKAQLELLHEAVEVDNADGIILIPINNPEIVAYVNRLSNCGFPVILLTSFIKAEYSAFVGCNYRYSGHIASGLISIITGGHGNLLVFEPNQIIKDSQIRLASMTELLHTQCPSLKIIDVIELPSDDIEAYLRCKEVFAKKMPVSCVIYASGANSGGLKAVLEEQEKFQFKVITYDLSDIVKKGLLENRIAFSIFQNPQAQGYLSMQLISDYLLLGKKPPCKLNYINASILIKESLEDIENQFLRC